MMLRSQTIIPTDYKNIPRTQESERWDVLVNYLERLTFATIDDRREVAKVVNYNETKAVSNFTSARGFFSDGSDGANIHRLRDRVFIADACDCDGKTTPVANSWFGDLGEGTASCVWIEQNSVFSSIKTRGIAISGIAGSSGAPAAGGGSIGVVGFGVNDGEDSTPNIWGGYFEGVRYASGGQAAGIEVDVTNLAASPNTTTINPYNTWQNGTTIGLSVGSGGSVAVWGSSEDTDVGLEFHPNGSQFSAGIIFRNGALVRSGGESGTAHAVMMAYDQCLEWYEYTTNTLAAYITSNITNASHDQRLIFHDGGLSYRNGAGNTIFTMQDNQNTVIDYLYVGGAASGAYPFIAAAGASDNVDVSIIPKGTGKFRFGTVVADATATIAGRVEFKDQAGNTHYLATVTPTP